MAKAHGLWLAFLVSMLKRVLVPLDGSKLAEAVLDPVVSLLAKTGGTLTLLHAVTAAEQFSLSARTFVQRERRHSAAYLARLAERLAEQGPGIQERVVTGEASKAIIAEAKRSGVDLIALSSHGRSGIREWAFGSVAERVLRGTSLPVLLFRGPLRGRFVIRKLAVALDGSSEALDILRPASELASVLGASIVLLHAGAKMPASIRDAARRLEGLRIPVELSLVRGQPATALLEGARKANADVLAFNPSAGSRNGRLFFGSVAERILKEARLPLLVHHPS